MFQRIKYLAITFVIIYIYDNGYRLFGVNILFSTFLPHLNFYNMSDKLV